MGNVLGRATGDGVETTNNLQLVQSVLPVVGDLSSKLDRETDKRDKRYGYLGNIQTSVRILAAHLKEIEENGHAASFETEINQIADCLEEIFSDQVVKLSKLKASHHRRLHAVIEIASPSYGLEPNMKHLSDFSVLNDMDAWGKLQRNLKSLTDKLQSYGENVDEVDEQKLPMTSQEPDKSVCDFVSRVFEAAVCDRHATPKRAVRLRIGTYKKGNLKPKSNSVCVLLAQDKKPLQWHELHIHDQLQPKEISKSSKAEHAPNQAEGCHPHMPGSTSCVCDYLKANTRPDSMRLDLVLNHDTLNTSGVLAIRRKFEPESLQEQTSLKTLLSVQNKPWTESSKWALAVVLAHSFLYLYNGSRTKGQWRRENIHFFNDGAHIPLQPFFGISLSPSKEEASQDTIRFHQHPEIVELGVILLEIHLGQRLESFLKNSQDIETDNDFYLSACEAFGMEKVGIISRRYQKAIEACLTPANFASAGSDAEKLRSILFQKIVQPLDEELEQNLPEFLNSDDLDEYAAKKCDLSLSMLSSSQRSANASRSLQPQQDDVYVAAQYNALLQLQPLGHAKANQTQDGYGRDVMDTELLDKVTNRSNDLRWNKGVVTWADESPTGELHMNSKSGLIYSERRFDEVVSPTAMLSDARIPDKDKRRINDWTVWLNDFKRFRQQILPDAVDPENQQRIRVTVIDTGIDGSHPYMQLKGWRSQDENAITDDQDDPVHLFCDFVEPDSARKHEPIDEDGHGTFIAGILLQAAPDIELSIARIGATRESIKNDIQIGKKIGDAITHAIEEWKTEIISISFGNEDMSWEIRDAIEKAIKQNVIVLAAAGNSGNRKGIPYPAVEDDVFKIFASKSNGYAAGFSPPPSHAPDYSYFIYGDGVVSTWPSSLLEQAKSNGLEVFPYNYEGVEEHSKNASGTWTLLSGTSFATPLAAALVAIIYQFHDVNKSSKSPIRLRHENKSNFKSRKAVRAIFTQMSRTSDKAPYNVLEPARGKDDNFLFRPHKFTGPHKASPLNIWDQTPIQFFSKRLTDILYIANV